MRTISTITFLSILSAGSAFIVPVAPRSSFALSAARVMTPELEAAIADVRECAASFSEETAHFANVWIDKMLEGKQGQMAAGLLEECLLDDVDGKCTKYEEALKRLDHLLGVGANEQF